MKTGIFNPKKHSNCQPGGWKCFCCGPSPKERPKFAKLHKRRTYRILDKLEQEPN